MVSNKNIEKKHALLKALHTLANDVIEFHNAEVRKYPAITHHSTDTHRDIFSQLLQRYKELCSDPLDIDHWAIETTDALTKIRVMKSHVEAELEPITSKLKQQKKMKKALEEKIERLESLSLQQAKSLEKFVRAEDFNLSSEDYLKFPPRFVPLLNEALNSYKNGNYFACCSVCGTLFEGVIKKACEDNNISYKGLAKGITSLKTGGIVASQKLVDHIVDLNKWLRDKSAHWTDEEFNKDKARIALSSLNILREELGG